MVKEYGKLRVVGGNGQVEIKVLHVSSGETTLKEEDRGNRE